MRNNYPRVGSFSYVEPRSERNLPYCNLRTELQQKPAAREGRTRRLRAVALPRTTFLLVPRWLPDGNERGPPMPDELFYQSLINRDRVVHIVDPDLQTCEQLSVVFRLEGYQTMFSVNLPGFLAA